LYKYQEKIAKENFKGRRKGRSWAYITCESEDEKGFSQFEKKLRK
jgi:hypothetical protein